MPTVPNVTAIVVSWNVSAALNRCLASLQNSVDIHLDITVVDNASSDGSAELVRKNFPNVRLIANPTNRGFAAAVNQGMNGSIGDVVLINPDVVVQPDTLQKLRTALDRNPSAGIAGPRIVFPDGTHQASVRRFPTLRDLVVTLMKLPNFLPQLVGRYTARDLNIDAEQRVDQVMGACFYIRRPALEAVGAFDEGFYIWFEEVDFCRRAEDRGWSTLYAPSAQVVHEKAASFAQLMPITKQRILVGSMAHYADKHLGRPAGILVRTLGFISIGIAALQQLLGLRKPSSARNL